MSLFMSRLPIFLAFLTFSLSACIAPSKPGEDPVKKQKRTNELEIEIDDETDNDTPQETTPEEEELVDVIKDVGDQFPTEPTPTITERQNKNSPIGTNMDSVRSWSPEWVFVDAFAKSRAWIASGCDGTWNTKKPLTLDSNEWILDAPSGVCPQTMVFDNMNGKYPAGKYILTWEGSGTISVRGDTQNRSFSGQNERVEINVTPSDNGLFFMVNQFSRSNPIKNIRLIMPGGVCGASETDLNYFESCHSDSDCSSGQKCQSFEKVAWNRFNDPVTQMNNPKVVFHPEFLKRLTKYRVIRFMDWLETNGSPVVHYSDRTEVKDQSLTTDYGVPYEYIVALGNILQADIWLNMPHMATDDYVRRVAQLVKDLLKQNLKTYVEYSNETWNAGFYEQYSWTVNEGNKLGLSDNGTGRHYHAKRTVDFGRIWKDVFGSEANRIITVLGAHSEGSWWTNKMLGFDNVANEVDAVAIAPYFGGYIGKVPSSPTERRDEKINILQNLTVNQVIQEVLYGGVIPQYPWGSKSEQDRYYKSALEDARDNIRASVSVAQKYNLPLIAYEGGQHLVGVGEAQGYSNLTNTLTSANKDPRMNEAYRKYLNIWKQEGGNLFVHFTNASHYNKYGSWGSLTSQQQPNNEAPKYRALMDFIDNNTCWWNQCE